MITDRDTGDETERETPGGTFRSQLLAAAIQFAVANGMDDESFIEADKAFLEEADAIIAAITASSCTSADGETSWCALCGTYHGCHRRPYAPAVRVYPITPSNFDALRWHE
jgi:hypothetical protein